MRARILLLVGIVLSGAAACRSEAPAARMELPYLSMELPASWRSVPPISPMRAAQVIVPGDGGEAELVVFHFGAGQGGDIEANLTRWMNQVIPAPGTTPKRETFEQAGLRITWVDIEGTIKPSDMGMGPRVEQPDSRMLAAVIEGQHGPWFVKLTGPAATVTPQREAFLNLLRSATPS